MGFDRAGPGAERPLGDGAHGGAVDSARVAAVASGRRHGDSRSGSAGSSSQSSGDRGFSKGSEPFAAFIEPLAAHQRRSRTPARSRCTQLSPTHPPKHAWANQPARRTPRQTGTHHATHAVSGLVVRRMPNSHEHCTTRGEGPMRTTTRQDHSCDRGCTAESCGKETSLRSSRPLRTSHRSRPAERHDPRRQTHDGPS